MWCRTGGNTRFANNLFYNFDTTSINPDSAFYQDNIWGVDPKLADPGTMGDGNADALLKENDITKAWKLDAYKLAEDSPAIGAGRAIRTEYVNLKDMLGNTVDAQKPDLGAIQYTPPVDKSSLQTLVNTSEQYYNQLDRYTPESARAFKAAYEEAMRVLADANADDAAVRAAYAALEAASKGLVEQAEHPEHPEQAEHLQRTINKRKAKTAHPQAGPYRQGITAHRVLRQRQRRCLQAEQFWLYW